MAIVSRPLLSAAYKRYVLGILTLVFTLNVLDRSLISLLLQPIKQDLKLSDTQLGFLTGIAFGLFYATLGLPFARWADRGNRATITSVAIGLWGVTVMACIAVANFPQLVLARIAAAVGEAGGMPPTYSLIGDYFPGAAERTRAMSVYWLANSLSIFASFVVGGWLNERYGWRMTFFIMGAPALIIAALVKLSVAEPRPLARKGVVPRERVPRTLEVLATLWRQASLRHLILALILLWMMGVGLGSWYAAFMMRSHGMGAAELGAWMGTILGLGDMAGTLLGGYIASRWFAGNERRQMQLSAVMIASMVPCFVLFLLLPDKHWALFSLFPLQLVSGFFVAPTFALMQRLVDADVRATTLAIVMLLANLIGMGLGPQIVGILSDWLRPSLGDDSLRYAMLTMSFVAFWSAYHFWRVGRTVRNDLGALSAPSAS